MFLINHDLTTSLTWHAYWFALALEVQAAKDVSSKPDSDQVGYGLTDMRKFLLPM